MLTKEDKEEIKRLIVESLIVNRGSARRLGTRHP